MESQLPEIESDSVSLITYSHDGYGLGHLRRTANIAARFVQETPGSTVLMLTGCPSGVPFQLPKGVDFIKFPSVIKVGPGTYIPASLRIGRRKARAIRSSIIQSAVAQFQPHTILVDHVPAGLYGELLSTLQMLRELDNPPTVVLGLRDIVDSPEVVIESWHKEMTYRTLREYYHEVLIYGCHEFFDSAAHYGLNTEFPGRVSYCGYVCSGKPLKAKEQVRADLRIDKEKLVAVIAGGGHDAYPLMQSCIDAFQYMGGDLPFEVVFITGPLMEPEQRERLRTEARSLRARVFASVEDPPSYVNAADFVITMGGYNSLCEVIASKKKALVVPRLGPRAEQRIRARMFQERGLIDVLDPSEVSPRKLACRIIEDLERTDFPLADPALNTDGARNAAHRMSALALEKAGVHPKVFTEPQVASSSANRIAPHRGNALRSNRILHGAERSRAT